MEKYTLTHSVNVFGFRVETFPQGIGEAFAGLMNKIDDGINRSYYGISKFDSNGNIIYYADAEEKIAGEAEKYGHQRQTIPAGNYLAVKIENWRNNLECIKDVFHNMMQDKRVDTTMPCIEWYKTNDEMLCLMHTDPVKELFASIDEGATELMNLLLPLSENQINRIPFKDSWTAAQLARHVTKSNKGMTQALEMHGKPAERDPMQRVKELKDTFLNFDLKLKSPDFIVPEEGVYKKDAVLAGLKNSNDQLKENAIKANPGEMINLPAAFGEITKLELFHFVLYHTQRHIHQLKNILTHL